MDKIDTNARLFRRNAEEPARLVIPQLCVQLIVGDQFGVAALFDDAAFIEHDQSIHRGDGG